MRLDRGDIPWILLLLSGITYIIVGIAGEYLGWWNDVGQIIIASGVPQLFLALVLGAGRKQVNGVGQDVRQVGHDVREVGHDVREVKDEVRATRREHGTKFDAIIALLTDIRDRLPPR